MPCTSPRRGPRRGLVQGSEPARGGLVRRALVACSLGALATAALPPANVVIVLVPAFGGLLVLLERTPPGARAFWLGWWFGFGFFVAGLHWIANALLVDAERYAWLIPFAFLGLPALLACYSGLATFAARWWKGGAVPRALVLACTWTATEWLRGHLFTGFPWNLIGYAWTGNDAVLQVAAFTVIYGLSLLTVLVASMPAVLLAKDGASRRSPSAVAACTVLIVVVAALGRWRLDMAPMPSAPGIHLRLVQPNINQADKWDEAQLEHHLQRLLRLSASPASRPPDVVIWPEAAVPFSPDLDVAGRARITAIAPAQGLVIVGAIGRTGSERSPAAFWNSIFAIDASGTVLGRYDKAHLVPFGEFMPLRRRLPLDAIAAGELDFSSGPGPRTLVLPHLPDVGPSFATR